MTVTVTVVVMQESLFRTCPGVELVHKVCQHSTLGTNKSGCTVLLPLAMCYRSLFRFAPSPTFSKGFPGGSVMKNPPANAGDVGDVGLIPGKIPWRRTWHPTPVFLPRKTPWTEEPGGLQSMG